MIKKRSLKVSACILALALCTFTTVTARNASALDADAAAAQIAADFDLISNAIQQFHTVNGDYPETLEALKEAGFLEQIPAPSFDWASPVFNKERFRYYYERNYDDFGGPSTAGEDVLEAIWIREDICRSFAKQFSKPGQPHDIVAAGNRFAEEEGLWCVDAFHGNANNFVIYKIIQLK